ncbi:MAG: hypothetical protein CMH57_08720 [Myxococcales bacterium]|nr:hypothetical protein [Myxococcales bacterium]
MPVTPLPYITFANTHYPGARFNLAHSNVPALELSHLDVPRELLNTHPVALWERARVALAARYGVTPAQVTLTSGCSGANASMAALLGAGATVLTERPGYEPMSATPTTLGLRIQTFQRTPGTWGVDPDVVEAALTPETRAVWLTNPHNPSGALTDADTLRELAQRLARRDVLLYVDEIYLDFASPLGEGSAAALGENVIISSSLTKVYGLGTLRFGWMVGPEALIRELAQLQIHLNGMVSGVGVAYGLTALADLERVKRLATGHLGDRDALLRQHLTRAEGFRWTTPPVGIVGLLQIDGVEDDLAFVRALIAREEVTLTPASFFGVSGHFRLGFGTHEQELVEGLTRLTRFARAWRLEEGHGQAT